MPLRRLYARRSSSIERRIRGSLMLIAFILSVEYDIPKRPTASSYLADFIDIISLFLHRRSRLQIAPVIFLGLGRRFFILGCGGWRNARASVYTREASHITPTTAATPGGPDYFSAVVAEYDAWMAGARRGGVEAYTDR